MKDAARNKKVDNDDDGRDLHLPVGSLYMQLSLSQNSSPWPSVRSQETSTQMSQTLASTWRVSDSGSRESLGVTSMVSTCAVGIVLHASSTPLRVHSLPSNRPRFWPSSPQLYGLRHQLHQLVARRPAANVAPADAACTQSQLAQLVPSIRPASATMDTRLGVHSS